MNIGLITKDLPSLQNVFFSFSIYPGFLYTGTSDGQIVKIKGEEITNVARLGVPPCGRVIKLSFFSLKCQDNAI